MVSEQKGDDGIFDFLIEGAEVGTIAELLIPDADVIRLYDHYPEPVLRFWEASVPLSAFGPNRDVLVQSMAFNVEMSRSVFCEIVPELGRGRGGLSLVQSKSALPNELHPRGFRKEETLFRVLRDCGACLYFELPHANETAGLTVFGRDNYDYLIENDLIAPE